MVRVIQAVLIVSPVIITWRLWVRLLITPESTHGLPWTVLITMGIIIVTRKLLETL